ncbi:MAG TPA: hypothetical protein VNJ01_12200 [Bacteriovoracaceae bacterium]|nr:hypothetical protein [Bacteriovoracaceae bacterium]
MKKHSLFVPNTVIFISVLALSSGTYFYFAPGYEHLKQVPHLLMAIGGFFLMMGRLTRNATLRENGIIKANRQLLADVKTVQFTKNNSGSDEVLLILEWTHAHSGEVFSRQVRHLLAPGEEVPAEGEKIMVFQDPKNPANVLVPNQIYSSKKAA